MMKKLSANKGLAMVEFTILLPLLLFLLLTTIELGRAFYTYTELEKLSRDSARYLANELVTDSSGSGGETIPDDIRAEAINLIVYGSTTGGTESLIPKLAAEHVSLNVIGNRIQVEIVYPFQPVLTQIPDLLGAGAIALDFNMTSSYTMRVLQ